MQRVKGIVKSFSPLHGYGFIRGDDDETYFFHNEQWGLRIAPAEGIKVYFEPIKTAKGKRAKDIKLKKGQ